MSLAPSLPGARQRHPNWKWISIAIASIGVAVLVGANVHLVYVALRSQPDCVPHARDASDPGDGFRAAKSAC